MGYAGYSEDILDRRYESRVGNLPLPKIETAPVENFDCPICETLFLSEESLRAHIVDQHTKYQAYIQLNNQIVRKGSFVDQIESFFIVPLGRKSIECVIKFNGQIKEKLKCIEKTDLTELFVSLGEGEISIHFNNNSYSIFCGKQSEFNVQETDQYAFDCLFFPLNQKAELQSDKYLSFPLFRRETTLSKKDMVMDFMSTL